jgi:hypothetical protein
MSAGIENTHRSNHGIFFPQSYGSPLNDITKHISGLGLARLDFERWAVAGETLYKVEGDSTPTTQQDDEARIATLAYALKKLGNPEDAAEFMRRLNAICEEDDARYRQVAASYYYRETAERGAAPVLKEMALLAMQLASLNPVTEAVESGPEAVYALSGESRPGSLFDLEVTAVNRMIRGRRKSAGFVHDEWTEWLNDLEANGATLDELDDAFAHVEALDQYDEGGAIVHMSAHERTVACGRADHEFTADSLFAVALDKRGQADGVRAFSAHPGRIRSDLSRFMSEDKKRAVSGEFKTAEQGSATSVWCATSVQLNGKGGVFCLDADIAEIVQPIALEGLDQVLTGVLPWAIDSELAERLWVLSEELTGVKLSVQTSNYV